MFAVGDSGNPVAYWFAYKLPAELYAWQGDPSRFRPSNKARVAARDNDGYRYLYYEPGGELALSPHSLAPDGTAGAVHRTLDQIFAKRTRSAVGWLAYNDEYPTPADVADAGRRGPGFTTNSAAYGHCKGVLAFDARAGKGFWLLHSFPRWPVPGETTFPSTKEDDRLKYAQTFLCMSLGDLDTVEKIAGMLRGYHRPQVIGSSLSAATAEKMRTFAALIRENSRKAARSTPKSDPHGPGDGELRFSCVGPRGEKAPVHLFAKSARWGLDFWIDLVADRLGTNLDVETWRRNTKTVRIPHERDADGHLVLDGYALYLAQRGWYFSETQDHGKWAVGAAADSPIACIGDINRQTSQEKRGGGAVVLNDAALAKALRDILVLIPREKIETDDHALETAPLGGPDELADAATSPAKKKSTRRSTKRTPKASARA